MSFSSSISSWINFSTYLAAETNDLKTTEQSEPIKDEIAVNDNKDTEDAEKDETEKENSKKTKKGKAAAAAKSKKKGKESKGMFAFGSRMRTRYSNPFCFPSW